MAAPVLFGRRMKPHPFIELRLCLDLGDFSFCIDHFPDHKQHRALVLFQGFHAASGEYRSQPAALRSLVQMRNRLVKSLTPEGR